MSAPPPRPPGTPGWYPDPSGLAGTFRWWDGARWSTHLTTDPATASPPSEPPPSGSAHAGPRTPPGPGNAPPRQSTPPGPYPGASGPTGQSARSDTVPPPPGAPGPGYVAPTDGARPDAPPTDVLSSDPDEPQGYRQSWVFLLVGALVLAVLTGGGYVLLRDTDEVGASPNPSDGPTAATSKPSPSSEPTRPHSPTPRSEPTTALPPDPQPELPSTEQRLTYERIGGGWQSNPQAAAWLPGGRAETQITEPGYSANSNWQALLSVGYAQPEWVSEGDLEATAANAAQWFAANGFGEAEVTARTTDNGPTTIGDYDGYILKQHFSYSLPNLEAEGETVYIVTVDLDEATGVFVAAIPDTHEQLVDDADQALDSLTVAE